MRSIGSDLRMDYTAVGQTTHLAARMEQLATPGTIRLTRRHARARRGLRRGEADRPDPGQGPRGAGGGLRARRRARREDAAAGGAGARPHALRRARHRDRSAPPRGGGGAPRARPDRRGRRRAGRRQVAALLRVHPLAPRAGLARARGGIGLLRQGDAIPAARRSPAQLLQDRGARRHAEHPRQGDGQAAHARSSAQGHGAGRPVAARRARGRTIRSSRSSRRSAASVPSTASSVCSCARARSSRCCSCSRTCTGSTARRQAFLDSLVESLPTAPILLAVNYRPEYRHGGANKTYYRQLRIDPLAPESADDLLDALLGDDASVQPLKPLLIERTEGNPLFLEESVRTLVETGALVGERGAYRLARPSDTIQIAADGPGDHRRAHRSAASRGQAPAPGRRRRRHGRAVRPARADRGDADERAARRARRAADRGVPVRGAALPRSRVHVQARAHARGRVRQRAPGSAARAPRRASWKRSSGSTPTVSPSRSSGWRIMRSGEASPRRPCDTCGRPARRRWPFGDRGGRRVSRGGARAPRRASPDDADADRGARNPHGARAGAHRRSRRRRSAGGGDLPRGARARRAPRRHVATVSRASGGCGSSAITRGQYPAARDAGERLLEDAKAGERYRPPRRGAPRAVADAPGDGRVGGGRPAHGAGHRALRPRAPRLAGLPLRGPRSGRLLPVSALAHPLAARLSRCGRRHSPRCAAPRRRVEAGADHDHHALVHGRAAGPPGRARGGGRDRRAAGRARGRAWIRALVRTSRS